MKIPHRGQHLTPQEQAFNTAISGVRQCVEWEFRKVVRLWAFLDCRKNLKVFLSPVGKVYMVGVILSNCHTCLHGIGPYRLAISPFTIFRHKCMLFNLGINFIYTPDRHESTKVDSAKSTSLLFSYRCKTRPTSILLGNGRWNCYTNVSTNWQTEGCLLWTPQIACS